MSHLRVENLSIAYRDDSGKEAFAVAEANLAVARGESLGIVGESGSGKSTLARSLLGYVRPGARISQGRIRLGERDVLGLSAAELRSFRGGRAAMVPQNPLSSLTPHLRVGDQLAELVRAHTPLRGEVARKRVHDLMERTGLPDPDALARRYPHELSGGQRQRAVIAAALIGTPELIVLDEPTTALDKTVEARVLALIEEIRADLGATLVYVSHDLNVIRRVCSGVIVMRNGRIVEAGRAETVLRAPQSSYARALVAAIPRIDVPAPPSAAPGAPVVLRTSGLSFAYPAPRRLFAAPPKTAPALDAIDLEIRRGETLGVVGESGSGKSTLAALIAGALAGHRGRIQLGDRVVNAPAAQRTPDLRRRIQLVFQDPLSALNPTQTVAEILSRPLRLYHGIGLAEARDQAAALLAEMGMDAEMLARRPRQLSGGQQQRVGLARALAARPDLVICDEVTSALDVTIQAQVLDLFLRLQSEHGLTSIFISHDLAVIARVSHQIAVLEGGRLREIGPRDRILGAPQHPYTQKLILAAAGAPSAAPADLGAELKQLSPAH